MSAPIAGRKPSVGRVFGPPLLIALISCSGLIAAFAFGDVGRVLCWLGIGAPIVVIVGCALQHRVRFRSVRRRWSG
jgi:hypothetical protein